MTRTRIIISCLLALCCGPLVRAGQQPPPAAETTPGVLREPKPFVFQKSLGDFYIDYELNAFTDAPLTMQRTYSDLHENILDAFNEYGVQITSPNYEGDPDDRKIVPKERWYAAPAKPPADPKDGGKE